MFIALCLLTALLGRLVYSIKPFSSDASMFIYMGKIICEGGRFGHDIIDNKFPTVGLLTSICWRSFGANWMAYVVMQTILSLLGCYVLARSARRHFGDHAALPTSLCALIGLNLNITVFGGFQLETLHAFFAILAASAAMNAIQEDSPLDSFVVGLCAGCAAMAKPTGLAVAGAFAVVIFVKHHRQLGKLFGHLLAMSAGLAIPTAVVLIYLVQTDTLKEMPALYRQISRYAQESAWILDDYFKPFIVGTFIAFPLVVRGWVFRRDRIETEPVQDKQAVFWFMVLWLAMEMIGVVAQRRMYAYHFLVLAPPTALLFGMIPRHQRTANLLAALFPLIVLSVCSSAEIIRYEYRPYARLLVSDYLIAHAQPNDAVWQDDAARLWLETGLRPASRHPLTFLFTNYDTAPLDYTCAILQDFEQRKPTWIVLRSDLNEYVTHQTKYCAEFDRIPLRRENFIKAWGWIEQYVKLHYRPEILIGNETVWRRI